MNRVLSDFKAFYKWSSCYFTFKAMTQLYACGYIAELQLFHTKDRFAPLIKLPVICANKFRFTFLRLRFIQYESLYRKLYKSYISLSVSS